MPRTIHRRPDLERIVGRIRRGEQKNVGGDVVMRIIEYAMEVETQRRNLIRMFREKASLPMGFYS